MDKVFAQLSKLIQHDPRVLQCVNSVIVFYINEKAWPVDLKTSKIAEHVTFGNFQAYNFLVTLSEDTLNEISSGITDFETVCMLYFSFSADVLVQYTLIRPFEMVLFELRDPVVMKDCFQF
jgi:hypothetical protein